MVLKTARAVEIPERLGDGEHDTVEGTSAGIRRTRAAASGQDRAAEVGPVQSTERSAS